MFLEAVLVTLEMVIKVYWVLWSNISLINVSMRHCFLLYVIYKILMVLKMMQVVTSEAITFVKKIAVYSLANVVCFFMLSRVPICKIQGETSLGSYF